MRSSATESVMRGREDWYSHLCSTVTALPVCYLCVTCDWRDQTKGKGRGEMVSEGERRGDVREMKCERRIDMRDL